MADIRLQLTRLGPIESADLNFGDLTVLVEPQASGKSIALQMLKLLLDTGPMRRRLREYGVDWDGRRDHFLDAVFGEGMHRVWGAGTNVIFNGSAVTDYRLLRGGARKDEESTFYIPAQRVLTLS